MVMTDGKRRAEYAAALREIADRVEADAAFPVPDYPQISESVVAGTDEEEVEIVRQAAAGLGVVPTWNKAGTHFTAVARYGPIQYDVIAVMAAEMARYTAHMDGFSR